jgi:gliding motility-associated-like protein
VDHSVTLTVTDSTGCRATRIDTVFSNLPNKDFSITPDQIITSICADSPVDLSTYTGTHIDTIYWDFGDGTSNFYSEYVTGEDEIHNGSRIRYEYSISEGVTLENIIDFNHHAGRTREQFAHCLDTITEVIDVQPAFTGRILGNRICKLLDTAVYRLDRVVNDQIEITDFNWYLRENATFDTLEESTEEVYRVFLDPDRFISDNAIYTFGEFRDANNCFLKDSAILDPSEFNAPRLEFENDKCVNENIGFTLYSERELGYGSATHYVVNQETGDTLVRRRWEQNFSQATGSYDAFSAQITPAGDVNVSQYIVTPDFDRFGNPIECRAVNDTSIFVYDIPKVDFEYDSVCSVDQAVQFTNTSTTEYGEITGYLWDFGDGNTSTEENPSHVFETGGIQNVTLTAYGSVCDAVKILPVYSKPKPVADFEYGNEYLEAFMDIEFINNSYIEEGEIIAHSWDFGNGDTSNVVSPIYMYDEVDRYNVSLVVTSDEGCTDTIIKPANLNVHLELPNAFTPDNDGENDVSRLLHYNIKELIEFKIYNRWGQLIFDAGDDLDAAWDGTFKGTDQEVGVYIAYVKAIGAYDREFNFKVDLTLIR